MWPTPAAFSFYFNGDIWFAGLGMILAQLLLFLLHPLGVTFCLIGVQLLQSANSWHFNDHAHEKSELNERLINRETYNSKHQFCILQLETSVRAPDLQQMNENLDDVCYCC